jgi:hypothetical protein
MKHQKIHFILKAACDVRFKWDQKLKWAKVAIKPALHILYDKNYYVGTHHARQCSIHLLGILAKFQN